MSYFVMKSIARVVPNAPSSFNHRFGGTPVHRGIKPRGGQDVPEAPCPNKKCEYHKYDCFLRVFAVVWNNPAPKAYLWDDDPESNEESQTIFQICPKCGSIYACNRCT